MAVAMAVILIVTSALVCADTELNELCTMIHFYFLKSLPLFLLCSNADDGIGAADAPPRAINDVPVPYLNESLYLPLASLFSCVLRECL